MAAGEDGCRTWVPPPGWKVNLQLLICMYLQVLTGDMLLAAAFVSYAGPFTSKFRALLIADWIRFLREKGAPMTPGITDPLKVPGPPHPSLPLLLFGPQQSSQPVHCDFTFQMAQSLPPAWNRLISWSKSAGIFVPYELACQQQQQHACTNRGLLVISQLTLEWSAGVGG